MDCRKFHKDLDDYLDDGLDFAGRFAMERHAQQCIRCDKVMAEAQRLRQMAQQLERVKAPVDFESRILAEIGREKSLGGFSFFRRFWLYGFDFPSARRLALASSFLVVLGIGVFYLYPVFLGSDRGVPSAASAPKAPAVLDKLEKIPPAVPEVAAVPVSLPAKAEAAKTTPGVKETGPSNPDMEQMVDREVGESDYVEFRVIGPDNRPVSVRWPNKSRTRYGQSPEEYFIRNVSH
jgi:anti-sigma factor RsiW